MARNRMIKPEFWSSESLMRVSRESRLTFIGIWNFCDDYGFYLYSIRSILGDVYPIDESVTEAKLKTWIDELISIKVLIPVSYNGKKLLYVKSWTEHQTVQHKSKRCHIEVDDIEGVIKSSLESHEDLMKVSCSKEKEKVKEKVKEKEESYLLVFENFRKSYPGTKKGLETEFSNFKKKHKDWREVTGDLRSLLICQINQRDLLKKSGGFVPEWKHLSTWINQRCWEEEFTTEIKPVIDKTGGFL